MVRLRLNGEYLDLFNDENIELSDSVQNISDITKVFTSYTQSFTVPATPKNNRVFRHWYNPDIYNGFDAQTRVVGWIELNDRVFRVGTWLLEKVNMKKLNASSYTISFTGDVFDVKLALSDFTLADLDYTQLVVPYNATNVIALMQSDIFGNLPTLYFPLVSSKNFWTFGGGSSTDISVNGNLHWYELFPSISFDWLLRKIVSQFNLPIDVNKGDIFGSDLLVNTHLYFKNQELNSAGLIAMPTLSNKVVFSAGTPFINATTDTIQFPIIDATNYTSYITYNTSNEYEFINNNFKRIQVTFTALTGNATVYLFRNGVEYKVLVANSATVPFFNVQDNETYELYIKTDLPQTVSFSVSCITTIKFKRKTPLDSYMISTSESIFETRTSSTITTAVLNINTLAPKIKLVDFFKAVVTMFNGTISKDEDLLTLQTLERWYLIGDKLDLTPYIDTDSIDVIRPKLPKIINFKKDDSKSTVNVNYTSLTGQKYGDLNATFDYDGSDVNFTLPFETPIPVQLATDIMAMFLIDKDSKPYTPKGMFLTYAPKVTSPNIHVDNGAGHTVLPEYYPVSVSHNASGLIRSINWGAETNQQTGDVDLNSLYQLHYSNYISNLYNAQSRPISVSANLNETILNKLTLNDRIIFAGRSYIMNDYKVDLNSGKATMNLLNDYREPIEEVVYLIDSDEQTVSHTQDTDVSVTFETSSLWYGNFEMGVNYTQQTSNPITVLIPENTSLATRKGYYFIFFFENGIALNRVVRVTIIQTGFAAAPLTGLITTDGEYITTTDGEYITTT